MAAVSVGVLFLTLELPAARSLKDRRRVVRSLSDRLRARCQVAVAETGGLRTPREAEVSVVAVGAGRPVVDARLKAAAAMAFRSFPAEVVGAEIEWAELAGPESEEESEEGDGFRPGRSNGEA